MENKLGAVFTTACVLLGLAMGPAMAPAAAATQADSRFKTIYTKEWKWRVSEKLARAEGERGVSAEIARVDAPAQEARRVYWEGILKELDAIRPAELSPNERINFAVYRAQIAALLDAQRFREYEQPVNADSAFWTDVTFGARRPFKSAEDYRNYLRQLENLPGYFDQ